MFGYKFNHLFLYNVTIYDLIKCFTYILLDINVANYIKKV